MKNVMATIFFSLSKCTRVKNWSGFLFCCVPLLIFLSVIFVLHLNPFHWVPLWSDEVWWYSQIDAVVKYGRPLGFVGCNEAHAPIGTFGFWGGAIIYAMAFFGKVFGWHHWSPLFMNVFYMTLANIVFFVLSRPKGKVALRLALLNCVLFVNIQYMFTSMSECTKFSMAIVLSGIFYFLLNEENRKRKSYLLVLGLIAPIALIFFANCYIMFSFLFPVYGYVLLKYWNPKKYHILMSILLCILMPILATFCCMLVLQNTAAPYPGTFQGLFNQSNIFDFFKTLLHTVVDNYRSANISFILNNSKRDAGWISSFLLSYYFLLGVVLFNLAAKLKQRKDIHPLDLLIAYALLIFIGGFLSLYTTKSSWNYIRGLNVALVFSMYIVCLLEWPKITCILFCIAFMQFLPFITMLREGTWLRLRPQSWYGGGYEMFERYSTVFSDKMQVSQTADNWENTYALYGRIYNFYCMVPAGLGQNNIFNGQPVSNPRYIITDKTTKLEFNEYRNIYEDETISIYEKNHSRREAEK